MENQPWMKIRISNTKKYIGDLWPIAMKNIGRVKPNDYQ